MCGIVKNLRDTTVLAFFNVFACIDVVLWMLTKQAISHSTLQARILRHYTSAQNFARC